MKIIRQIIAACMILLTIHTYGQQGIFPLGIEIQLESGYLTKAELLDTITKKTDVHFSYNPELLGAHEKVNIGSEKRTVLSILKEICNPEILGFHSLDNQIILFPLKSDESEAKPQIRYLSFNGSVTELKNGEPVPYCNISIIGKEIGTISNNDGKFSIKIPVKYQNDTLRFSCLGFLPFDLPIKNATDSILEIELEKKFYHLNTIEVVHYNPTNVLQMFFENIGKNYNNDYALYTTFYREIIQENSDYSDISEAVLKVLKAPYQDNYKEDLVRFIKGRKSSSVKPFEEIRLKLKGGPYYITKLDVVKNGESFIDPEFIHLYTYKFQKKTLLYGHETVVISFTPIVNLRDMLYKGLLYFDIETWALSRIEFSYTRQGLKEARNLMIEKEPRGYKAIPSEMLYQTQYILIGSKWHLYTAQSSMQIKIYDKVKNQKTKFQSISEILTTNIETGNLQHFNRKDIFSPNEFFTEKINAYDKHFWEDYNVIEPEDELKNALKDFKDHELIITNKPR